jgi:hypothetical protein
MMKAQIIAAAGLLFTLRAQAQATLASGTGFGTYYYDTNQVQACGTDFSAQNQGGVECSFSTLMSLDQIDSNYLVAMNHSQLVGDMASYCGKKVIVSVNGVPSSLPLFIGDGCQRCGTGSSSSDVWNVDGAPGLDFSYSVLSELSASACTDGHISISWEIVDETLFNFDTNAPGSASGPVGGSGSSSPTTTTPTVPTTLMTVAQAATGTSTVASDASTVGSATSSNPSAPCATGAWQCSGNALAQCLDGSWTARYTCAADMTCQGGDFPYCAPSY